MASVPTPLEAWHLYTPAWCLVTSARMRVDPEEVMSDLGIWSLLLLQLSTGWGLPRASQERETVVPFLTTIWPLEGCVVMVGGTAERMENGDVPGFAV